MVALAVASATLVASAPSGAVAAPATAVWSGVPGAGGPRPRAVLTPGTEADLAARVGRDPYRAIFLEAHARHEARRATRTPGDPGREPQKDMARAARWLAFEYAIDRTVVGGQVVPFPDAAARQQTGAIVEELLQGAYGRSRLAVPPPLGGTDRDIDTAGEIVQWTGAFDTLLGAGYDFGGADQAIAANLIGLTSELYRNFSDPPTAGNVANLHQNNHRSKSGVAMATGAVVLAEYVDPADADPSHDPEAWWDYGITQVDEVLRHMLVTGDGAYAEGTHYQRFTTESIAPFVGMWERLLGDGSWTTGTGRVVPALQHTPQFARTQDWMVAMTLPDGTLAPIDDANTQGAQHFGALPPLPRSDDYAWRWATATPPYAQEGTIDLAVDSIVAYDDGRDPSPPEGSPTSFWYEGGNAVFRSDWSRDATLVIAEGEGLTASEFGRDATGEGRWPESHEHMEPGSFLLHARGEALVLDPGYLSFGEHGIVKEPSDHNMVLVDGEGPRDPLLGSLSWSADPFGPPPQDGFASVHSTLDTARLDAATVTTRYGRYQTGRDITLTRRFLFVDDRYLVIADEVTPQGAGGPVELDWVLNGNGGGTSGGTFTPTEAGGVWTRPRARVESAQVTSAGTPAFSTVVEEHESPAARGQELTHDARHAAVTAAGTVRSLQVVLPSGTDGPAPVLRTEQAPGGLSVQVDDAGAGRGAEVTWDAAGLHLLDQAGSGTDRIAYSDGPLAAAGGVQVSAPGAAGTGFATLADGAVELIAERPAHSLVVDGLGFAPGAVDGGCGLAVSPRRDRARITPSSSPSVVVRPGAGPSTPGAVGGRAEQRAPVGTTVTLDGRGSCDLDGGDLVPRWELVSAPRGSAWRLDGADTWTPTLAVDADGTFRARLVVTDAEGHASTPIEVVVAGGDRCHDERDDDLDGLFDAADPDCDGPEPAATSDAVGFLLPVEGYTGAIRSGLDQVTVTRGVAGKVIRVRTDQTDGDRHSFVDVRRTDDGHGEGIVGVRDPGAGIARLVLWSGTLVEPLPGVLAGIDEAGTTAWIVVDRPPAG